MAMTRFVKIAGGTIGRWIGLSNKPLRRADEAALPKEGHETSSCLQLLIAVCSI
jgi:hypothetical protein